jgi:predicted ATP-dependent endonuclease of OLD family
MYLNNLRVNGFRCFEDSLKVEFNGGLNVIVGENGAGKTAIINAIRQLFVDSESGRYFVSEKDFYREFSKESLPSKEFTITAHFDDLDGDEKVAFLHWCDEKGNASLNLHVENKEVRGRYKRSLWGGKSRTTVFEPETVDLIHCIYLPPLRDAELKLSNGRQSRLSKLLKALSKKELEGYRKSGKLHPLEEKVATFNQELAESKVFGIERANNLITDSLKNSIGDHFGQNTLIQFTESDFTKIVEGLRLLFFPDLTKQDNESFRSLEENSLGYNNLLYVASILAELTILDIEGEIKDSYFKLLLIEEPEAHLHPQLQVRLLKYIAEVAEKKSVQVIVTTHSTVLASSVDIDSIIHLSNCSPTIATPLVKCGLPTGSKQFINRWLDVTKSNLLFASGLILVEGIAEQMLLPLMAKEVLKDRKAGSNSLEDLGVSVINLNGIYFKHFMRLYCNFTGLEKEEDQIGVNIPIRCAGLTDRDPPKSKKTLDNEGVEQKMSIKPHDGDKYEGTNHALKLLDTINSSDNSRLFVGKYKTLEYDLAMEGNNIQIMSQILFDLWPTDDENKGVKSELKNLKGKNWCCEPSVDKADAAYIILNRIDDQNIGKGQFSQILADKIVNQETRIKIPQYIVDAIHWACSTEPMENKDA